VERDKLISCLESLKLSFSEHENYIGRILDSLGQPNDELSSKLFEIGFRFVDRIREWAGEVDKIIKELKE